MNEPLLNSRAIPPNPHLPSAVSLIASVVPRCPGRSRSPFPDQVRIRSEQTGQKSFKNTPKSRQTRAHPTESDRPSSHLSIHCRRHKKIPTDPSSTAATLVAAPWQSARIFFFFACPGATKSLVSCPLCSTTPGTLVPVPRPNVPPTQHVTSDFSPPHAKPPTYIVPKPPGRGPFH